MVAAADDQDELDQAINGLRMQLGFYGSTPAYKVVLEEHGWENIHFELNKLSKKGRGMRCQNLLMMKCWKQLPLLEVLILPRIRFMKGTLKLLKE